MRLAVDQGDPDVDDRVAGTPPRGPSGARTPFSTDGMNWRGTAPPTTLSTNSNPEPGRQRLDLDVAHGVLAVAAGLLDVPAVALRRAAEGLAQRHPQRHRVDLDAVPVLAAGRAARRRAPRPCTTARAGGSRRCCSSRSVGSSATSRARPCESLSSSALVCATIATGSSGSGISQGSISSGVVLVGQGVAGLGPGRAWRPRRCRRRSPARPCAAPCRAARTARRPARRRRGPRGRGPARPCPDTCTVASGRSVPENTRTSEIRPTYGSVVVLTTSATSGPAGSQAERPARLALGGGDRRQRVLERGGEAAGHDLEQLGHARRPAGDAAASTG